MKYWVILQGMTLGELTKKKKELDKFLPLPKELANNLEEWYKVELTYTSNAIEGNTLTRQETAEIITKQGGAVISGKSLTDQLEARNHGHAVELVKKLALQFKSHQFITEENIKAVHKIILTGIDDFWAGRYRQSEVFIRGSQVQFPLPAKVPELMDSFVRWLTSQQGIHSVKVAAEAHSRLVSIHPFIDGNGRTARLLMNLILTINGYPAAVVNDTDRVKYLAALEKAQLGGNAEGYYNLIYSAVGRSLDFYLHAVKNKPLVSKTQKSLTIGQLAKETGESIATIRFWTREDLLKISGKTPGGYQLYSLDQITKVYLIRKLQKEERLIIEEIKRRI